MKLRSRLLPQTAQLLEFVNKKTFRPSARDMDRLFSGAQQAGLAIRRLRGADRPFRVVYGAGTSAVVFIVCSVPQGLSPWPATVRSVRG